METEHWLQRLIAQGLTIGIAKRALLEDYYHDELEFVFAEYNALHRKGEDVEEERVGALEFLGALG